MANEYSRFPEAEKRMQVRSELLLAIDTERAPCSATHLADIVNDANTSFLSEDGVGYIEKSFFAPLKPCDVRDLLLGYVEMGVLFCRKQCGNMVYGINNFEDFREAMVKLDKAGDIPTKKILARA